MLKGQSSLEYLLLIGGGIIIAGVLIGVMMNILEPARKSVVAEFDVYRQVLGSEGRTTGRLEAESLDGGNPPAPGVPPERYPCNCERSGCWVDPEEDPSDENYNILWGGNPSDPSTWAYFTCTVPSGFPEGDYFISYAGWYNSPGFQHGHPDTYDDGETLRVYKTDYPDDFQRSTDQWDTSGSMEGCTFPNKLHLEGGDSITFATSHLSIWMNWFKIHETSLITIETLGVEREIEAGGWLGDGLVGLWHMNDDLSDGTADDSSGNGNSGLCSLGSTCPVFNTSNKRLGSGAYDFDGSNDLLNVGSWNPGSELTVAAWVFRRDTGDDRILCKSSGVVIADHIFCMGVIPSGSDSKIRVRIKTTESEANNVDSTLRFPTGEWVHIAFTYDGSQIQMYVNGLPAGSSPKTGDIVSSSESVVIGNVNLSDERYFNGLIDEVAVWNRALSEDEIQQLNFKTVYTGGTVCFDEEAPLEVVSDLSVAQALIVGLASLAVAFVFLRKSFS